ncbi:Golgi transport complex subunit 4 [Coemansia interrupta]|uniref:Golgi transport complex subunit 4 n=1 Tax=Coemansia interrupta TaxID=1126814 RepID=A0A9W8HHT3_9FUNG|nr:Golgi transport complex subunit 4 [Coemansia interrupta]
MHALDLPLPADLDAPQIELALLLLEQEEARVDAEIADAIDAVAAVDDAHAALAALAPPLAAVHKALAPAQTAIDAASASAGAISARVRFLDREVAQVARARRLVRDTQRLQRRLAALREATAGLAGDGGDDVDVDIDIEAAAAIVHEYAAASPDADADAAAVLHSPFVRFVAAPEPPAAEIARTAAALVARVARMFDAAAASASTRDIGRCLRLFPLLGEDLRGLDAYARFLAATVADRARLSLDAGVSPANAYALRLTRLLEVAAAAIDATFPLVEAHYGRGRMARVIRHVHADVARRAADIVDQFADERHVTRRRAQMLRDEPPPAAALTDHDVQDIAATLAELALLLRQLATFTRYAESRAAPEVQALAAEGDATRDRILAADEPCDPATGLAADSPLAPRVAWLADAYGAFEAFFVARSVARAMALDDTDALAGWDAAALPTASISDGDDDRADADPAFVALTSSCVDDVFFVLRTALDRAVATQQPGAVDAVGRLATATLGSALVAPLEARALAPWSPGDAARQRRALVALNNLDLAAAYLPRTAEPLRERVAAEWLPGSPATATATAAVDAVAAFASRIAHACQRGRDHVALHAVKPRVRAALQHAYRDIKYVLSDEEFNDAQADNLFQKRFGRRLARLARRLRRHLAPANCAALLVAAAAALAADWERAIRQSKFNMLGALMFDADVRHVMRLFDAEAVAAGASAAAVRPLFARLLRMADVLAVEAAVVDDAAPASDDPAALTRAEVAALLANRVDLNDANH